MVIAGISIDSLEESCKVLTKFINKNTVILVSADFGCELELIALSSMGNRCKCVLSIACDVECRQLSLGSYALVNDDHCEIYFGITYSSQNYSNNSLFVSNEEKALEELNNCSGSCISRMVSQLDATRWIKVKKYTDSQEMALKVWQLLIPKISLNILSIIYEQFDYEKMLENKSTEMIFKGLVHELLDICSSQCKSKVEEFLVNSDDDEKSRGTVNFIKIIEQCKTKRMELITTTANEYPEYLFLPFESYCFYHRLEYPAQILLYQPILLAERYNVSSSNLNFLYGFYTRLLSLSGLSINGGRLSQVKSHLGDRLTGYSSSSSISSTKKLKKKGKSRYDKKKSKGQGEEREAASGAHAGQGIFSVASPAGADYRLPLGADQLSPGPRNSRSFKASISANGSSTAVDGNSPGSSESGSDDEIEQVQYEKREAFFRHDTSINPGRLHSNATSVDQLRHFSRSGSQNALHELSTAIVPQFSRKYATMPLALTPMSQRCSTSAAQSLNFGKKPPNLSSVSSLELQLRSGAHLATTDSHDLYQQLFDLTTPPADQNAYDARRKQFGPFEKQLWQFQRRSHLLNGTVSRPIERPYDDLLNHIEILCGEHNSEIIRFTTSRYGDLDLYSSIQQDRDHIVSLFDRNSGANKKRPIKGSSKSTMGHKTLPHSS